jgi:tetratricopeptide (TPR) repeat protein
MHDREHRSALLWVDHIDVPVTPADQIHFLIWLVATLSEIVPIVWSRFDHADLSAKSAWDSDGLRVVLAGNPLADHVRRSGEEAARAWAESQGLWSPRELAAMWIEIALTHDPDEVGPAAIAERFLTRAAELDPESEASGLRATVWIRQGRFDDALAYARGSTRAALRVHVLTEILAHAAARVDDALALIDPATLETIDDSTLGELATAFAEHAGTRLDAYLARLPARASLVPHLYNASFDVPRQAALSMLGRVVELPEPPPADPENDAPVVVEADGADDDGGARQRQRQSAARRAYVMAWNNACIHAHALGQTARATALADGAQRFGPENPHIYHSAACAYTAAGQLDDAVEQVRQAMAHGYEHVEKMETDPDLAAAAATPAFARIFRDWRAARDDLN